MFKKALSWFLIAVALTVLAASTSRTFMSYVANKRDTLTWWGVMQFNHGDLASMSGLYFLKKFQVSYKPDLRRANLDSPKNTVLYIHGDSYLWKIWGGDSVFAGLSSFHYVGWHNKCNYHLDTSQRNVLIIEVAERLLREYYSTTNIINELKDTGASVSPTVQAPEIAVPKRSASYCSIFSGNTDNSFFFNKNINQNLHTNLFNYNFMFPLFGSKAALNYYLFTRASGDVVISNDKQYLFFVPTMTTDGIGSSFSPVTNEDVNKIIDSLNAIYDYYKSTGFDEIYFSAIPNTVTIMQPAGYNNLIPRVQGDPRLKMTVIDVYTVFKNSKKDYFFHGDTHWNNSGKQLWLDMVNDILRSKNSPKPTVHAQ